ncbi:MAG: cytochrome P450 [Saccharospirillum sp.]|uniref:cytochrome P450 n=1 Tax=Saccharospirillum sp. TaxID=2033801 RepID=UPI00329809B4
MKAQSSIPRTTNEASLAVDRIDINEEAPLIEIPGDKGLPLVGHTLEVLQDIQAFFDRKTRRYGPVFSTQFLGETWIRLTGPEGCQFLLQDSGNHFSTAQGWASFVGELFPRGLMLKDGEEHRYHRRIMQAAFKKDAMVAYQALMSCALPDIVKRWPLNTPVDLAQLARQTVLDMASRVFIGETDHQQLQQLQQAFRNNVEATMALVRKPWPGTKYNRGLQGRAFLERYFLNKVSEVRARGGDTLFAQLCRAKDEDGHNFTDQNIADHMIFLMMAAQDTTSSALTSLFYALTEYPQWQERLREEHAAFKPLTYEDLGQLTDTATVFKEVLRLFTPGAVIPRRALHDVAYQGYRIPAGTIVSVSPVHNHYLPEYWHEPERFDPERFSPDRQEDKQHPFLFAPFSGGAHKCIGMHFSEMEIKCILHEVLARVRIERDPKPAVRWQKAPVWHPKGKLMGRLVALT